MSHPAYSTSEALARETFNALMQALSYPGRILALPEGAESGFALIGQTLLDIETSFFAPDEAMVSTLANTGARFLTADKAAYHFYANLDDSALAHITVATVGTMLYPDQAATLIVNCRFGDGVHLTLTGPGVPTGSARDIMVSGVPTAFWDLREQILNYPLGWDVLLVHGKQVVGLPRTTQIKITGA
ncbi:MAG: phosphonate C-P lyase system protein PhnH [Chloroflexota bacterium]